MRVHFPATLAVLTVLAGCVQPAPSDDEPAPPGPDGTPRWSVGDWWTYRFTSDIYDLTFEATLVVGNVTADGYLVGMPPGAYSLDTILFHVPPVGFLGRNLSYNVHDVLFEPLRFPLADNATWDTHWILAPVHFTAREAEVKVPGGRQPGFHVSNAGHEQASNRSYELEYAPSVGWFTMYQRVDLDGRVRERIDLVGRGQGYTGPVRLLDGITMVYLDARTAASTSGPLASFTPASRLDTIFTACVFGDAAGQYSVEVRTPTKAACAASGTLTPGDTVRRIVMAEVPNEPGTWQARYTALGPGSAIAEVMGYRSSTVTLTA